MSTAQEEVDAAIDAAIAEERSKDCWCGEYRKPCEYHAGYLAGAELALRVLNSLSAATVDDWMAGA